MKAIVTEIRIRKLSSSQMATVYVNAQNEEQKFTCTDDETIAILEANKNSKELDLIIEGKKIIGIANEAAEEVPELPFDENDALDANEEYHPEPPEEDEEEEDATPKPAEAPKATKTAKPAKTTKTEPKAETPAEEQKVFPKAPTKASEAPAIPCNVMANTPRVTGGLTDVDKFKPNVMFPLLRAEEIECRIGQVDQNGKWLTLLLYKDARCDQDRFDAKYGPMGWQTAYQVLDGQLFCTVSVWDPDTQQWVGKTDVGTPSNTEAEKGRASDAFKRACVAWGSGRELYSAGEIKIYADKVQIKQNSKGKWACYEDFFVRSITYDEDRHICGLEVCTAAGKLVFSKKTK